MYACLEYIEFLSSCFSISSELNLEALKSGSILHIKSQREATDVMFQTLFLVR